MTEHDVDDWRRWVRRDVSGVQPLGSYAAKRCPVRTQLDVLKPGDQAGVSDFLRSLGAAGNAFEDRVFAGLEDEYDLTAVEVVDRAEAVAMTVAAMERGDPLIAGTRLPIDLEGRRVGEPDILVRIGQAPIDGRWRYAPVDVKSHKSLKPGKGAEVVVQTMDALVVPDGDADTSPDGRRDNTTGRGDLLQLAHYHRMLEACGHGSSGAAWGAIVGSEQLAVWYRLDRPLWKTPTSDPDRATRTRTSLEVYDFEFGFRLDIAAAAMDHAEDPTLPLLVDPISKSECNECPWRNHCFPQLEAAGDVSLLPGVSYDDWRILRDAGLGTIEAVANADPATIAAPAKSRVARLQLPARARLGDAPALLRRGRTGEVPWADVEVDIDMENIQHGAYLWGATVTVRTPTPGVEAGHRAFVTWANPLDDAAMAACFGEFWEWLTSVRTACADQGRTFVSFCWSASAENRFLREGAALIDEQRAVADFIASPEWRDLLAWFKNNWVTGHGNGLKTVAKLLGFEWRDDDPGGAASMTWYADAISEEAAVAAAARERLIAYNEDDCRATLAVRDACAKLV